MRVPLSLAAIGFNCRPLHFEDFEAICQQEHILWLRVPLTRGGFYSVIDGYHCIGLSDRLLSPELEIVAFHELGHFYFHNPQAHLFGQPNKSKAEFQAHALAACALIPRAMILNAEFAQIAEELNLPIDFVMFRARVWQTLHL